MDETPRATGPDLFRVLGLVPVGVVVAGPDRLVVDANPAACSLLHRSRSDLVGRPLVSLFCEADAPAVLDDVVARRRNAAVLRVADGRTAPVATVTSVDGTLVATLHPDDRSFRLGQALASVTATAPVAVFAIDREGVLTLTEGEEAAPIAKEAAGTPALGRSADDVFRARWLADVFRRALEGESVAVFGEVEASWYDAFVAPYRDASGRIAGVAGLTVDVTPRAMQERAHREAEERFHALADAAFEGIAIHVDGRILCCNEAFAALGQYTADEVVGKYAADLVVPELREMVVDRIRHLRDDPYRARAMRKDGTTFPCEVRGRGIPFQGRAARVVAIRDLTDQQAAEDALRRERDFNRTILDTTSALVVVLDPSGRVLLFNRRCEDVTGFGEADVRGQPLWDVVSDGEGPLREHLARVVVGESPVPFVWSWRTKDGRTRWIEGATAAMAGAAGETPVLISTGVDVTRRREAEERLRQSEETLRQAQKMEAIGRLAGGIAHDFNNLLTVIVAFADELADLLPAGTAGHEGAQHIVTAAERAAALTAQLLAFSRRHVYQPVPLDLGAAVRALEELLRRWLGDDIVLTTYLNAAGALVRSDPLQVEQVVMNLALNARDAMPRGGRLTITVRPERRTEPGGKVRDYVALVVEDTGTGMDEAVRSRMFEPFFSTKAEGKGTGLGLATVQGIVTQNRGHIEVETAPGRGTTFRVLWPRLEQADVASAVSGEEGTGPDLGGDEVILLAEDNDLVRDATATLLRGRGYRVLTARDGEDALRVADAHPGEIDLLLTDVIMPGMRGPKLAEMLEQRRPGLRVLLTSAFTDDSVEIGPGRPYLQKPFTAHALARKVREVLDG